MLPNFIFIALQYLLPQHLLSRLVGKLAETRCTRTKNLLIKAFATHFVVDMREAAEEDLTQYENFNAFFTRELKPGARPICAEENAIACPADGAVSEIGDIELGSVMQA